MSANKVLERAKNAAQKYLDRAPDPMPKAEAISACALVLVQVEEELYKLKSEIETLKESRAVAVDCEQTSRNEANRLRGELDESRGRLLKAESTLERLNYRHCDIAACACDGYHFWPPAKLTDRQHLDHHCGENPEKIYE